MRIGTGSLPITLVTVAVLASIVGCVLGDPAAPDEQVLDGTEWILTAIETPQGTIDATDLVNPAWLGFEADTLEADSSRVYGFGGCNHFVGNYRQFGSQLTVSDLWTTDMECLSPLMNRVEEPFLKGLGNAFQFSVGDDVLRIQSSGDTALNLSARINP